MRVPRVLVVAEGPSEFGQLDQLAGQSKRKRRPPEGYLPPMIRKLLGRAIELTAQRVVKIGRFEGKGRPRGHGDRAAKALALAAADNCDLLVFVKDVDRQPGKKKTDRERREKLKTMHEEIDEGFAAVSSASHVLRVKGTPCRMIEAWALGDPAAIAKVCADDSAHCPAAPEALWGDEKDPASNHPYCVLRRVLGGEPNSGTFEELAEEARPDTLRKSCPESFAPFHDEMVAAKHALK